MRRMILLFAFSVCALAGFGQDAQPQPTTLSQTDVQKLLERIDQLEKRVAELENKQPATAVGIASTASVAAPAESTGVNPPAAPAEVPMTMAAETHGEAETYPSLHIRGFADVDFSASDKPGTKSGFTLGQFVLHVASPLSKKISYFAELSFTATPGVYNVDLERTIIRYDWNDAAKISFGRYHTPINFWNTAYHHGSWLQTSISRPDMIQFGGRLIPVHFIGIQSEGNIRSGPLGLGYNVGMGNGRGATISRAGDAGDVNNNRAWLVNGFSRPTAFNGKLQFGGSIYQDEITLAAPGGNFQEWIASGHLAWTGESPEVLAEFANIHHRQHGTDKTWDSMGGYAQIAYRLPFGQRKWKPYYRYDYVQAAKGDPTFTTVENVRGNTLGMRFDISDYAAFKAEYRNGHPPALGLDRVNSVVMQTAFTF
jgi:hypothetical protein